MNRHTNLILASCVFIAGLVVGIVSGAALHEIFSPSITIEKPEHECPDCKAECAKLIKPPINFNEGDILGVLGDKPLFYGPPGSYMPDHSDKLNMDLSKNFLPAYINNKSGQKFTLNELTTPYNLIVMETPGCPYCFSNLEYLRELRHKYNKEELGIVIVNITLTEKSQAQKEIEVLSKLIESKNSKFQTEYKTTDANNFIHALIPAVDTEEWGQRLSLYSTPLMLLFDTNGKLLLRSEGYYDNNTSLTSEDKAEQTRRMDIIEKYVTTRGK